MHQELCLPMGDQIDQLETKGFNQETYRLLDKRFRDWNYGVWQHRWWLARDLPCALCDSPEPSVVVTQTAICLSCLNEYPLVPWHPTGAVRPRTTAFLSHALSCTSHSSPPTGQPQTFSSDESAS